MKFLITSYLLLLLGLTLSGCQNNNNSIIQTDNFETQALQIEQMTDTTEPTLTLTVFKPTITLTPRFRYAATPTESLSTPQVWRFEVFPGGKFMYNDKTVIQGVHDDVKSQAINLSVPEPYFWEIIELPRPTRFAEIEEHYVKTAQEHGFIIGRNEQGETVAGENTYLMTFIREDLSNTPRVTLEFWPKTADYEAFMIIFYSSPE